MQLMKLADVPRDLRERVYRYSPLRATVIDLLALGSAAALAGWAAHGHIPPLYYISGVIVLAVLAFRRLLLARLRSSNWLARTTHAGLYIQIRSYLNHHFPADDLTVAFIPYSEIASARLVRQRRNVPDLAGGRNRTTTEFRRLVEIELREAADSLGRAIAEEIARKGPREPTWYGHSSFRYQHYPVRMATPSCIEIEWRAVPGAKAFLQELGTYAKILEPMKISEDYGKLATLTREQQEKRLLELAETGQYIRAVEIARKLYSFDLREAKDFVDDLLGSKPGQPIDPRPAGDH